MPDLASILPAASFVTDLISAWPAWEESQARIGAAKKAGIFGELPTTIREMMAGREQDWRNTPRAVLALMSGMERQLGPSTYPSTAEIGRSIGRDYDRTNLTWEQNVRDVEEYQNRLRGLFQETRGGIGEAGEKAGQEAEAFRREGGADVAAAQQRIAGQVQQAQQEQQAMLQRTALRKEQALRAFNVQAAQDIEGQRVGMDESFRSNLQGFLSSANAAAMPPAQRNAEAWKLRFDHAKNLGAVAAQARQETARQETSLRSGYDQLTTNMEQVAAAEMGQARATGMTLDAQLTTLKSNIDQIGLAYRTKAETWRAEMNLQLDELEMKGLGSTAEMLNTARMAFPLESSMYLTQYQLGEYEMLMDLGAYQEAIVIGMNAGQIVSSGLSRWGEAEFQQDQLAAQERASERSMWGNIGGSTIGAAGTIAGGWLAGRGG